MGIPQWIIGGLLAFQIFAAFALDGRPKSDTTYNGTTMIGFALAEFALLSWGGFFRF